MPTYDDALRWLYAQSRGGLARDPTRMQALLRALSLPHPPRVIHVVGTNGKGTVTAMLAAAYQAAGVRVGRFLSPHVEHFEERIAVNGSPIDPEQVRAFVARLARTELPVAPAFFELTLALALEQFALEQVAVAVIEAGVGARNDATIVLENVAAVTVTRIARDHLGTLGSSLDEIARDKAAAIRPGAPVIAAHNGVGGRGVVRRVLREAAAAQGSPLHFDAPDDPLFALPAALATLEPALPARQENQRLAAATLRLLGDVSEEAIAAGLALPPLPGRGERFFVGETEIVLDGAHDPSAAEALLAALDATGARPEARPYLLLFAALPRKQGRETLAVLERRAAEVILTRADDGPLPAWVEAFVASGTSGRGALAHWRFVNDPAAALAEALHACPPGGRVVIAGSLYLAGRLRPQLRRLAGAPRWP